MDRREFNTLTAAALVAAGLPSLPAAAHHGSDDPGLRGAEGLPGIDRAYLTVTGGTVVYKTGRAVGKSTASSLGTLCLSGTVVSCVGYFPDDPHLYCLGQAFSDSFTKAGDIVTEFEHLRQLWSPRECLVESDTIAEKLLGSRSDVIPVVELDVTAAIQVCVDSADASKVKIVWPGNPTSPPDWFVQGPIETNAARTRTTRCTRGPVEGEALQALRVGRRLAEIHRWNLASLHLPAPAALPWPSE